MGQVFYKEQNTPEAFVSKYIANKIGLNIRHGKSIFNEDTKEWIIPLRAVVPSRVKLGEYESKTFIYKFEEVGSAIVAKVDNNYEMVSFPSSLEIDKDLRLRFAGLTEKMEKTLLQLGGHRWGKLVFINQFLRPLYTIAYNLASKGKISKADLEEPKDSPYLSLLLNMELVRIDETDVVAWLKPTELFTRFSQKVTEEHSKFDPHIVAQNVLGTVFSHEYYAIRQDQRIRVPTVYVDATKAYYLNAVRVGTRIAMAPHELLAHYKLLERSQQHPFKFVSILGELVSVNLLSRDNDENILGDEDIFDKVLPLRKELLEVAAEAK